MRTIGALLLVFALAACSPYVATAPSPSASAPPSPSNRASPTPTATAPASGTAPTTTTPIPLPTSVKLAAAGNSVLWALVADSHLFRSTDRGDTWQQRQLPQPAVVPAHVAFVNDRDGWMLVASTPEPQCQSQVVRLYRTSDGAATWQLLDARGIPPAQCKDSLAFTDLTHGYVTTGDVNGSPLVYRTSDGGLTWSASSPLPDPPGFITRAQSTLRAAPVADFGPIQFVNGTGIQAGREANFVFQSTDRGVTWTHIATAPQGMAAVFVTSSRWIQLLSGDQSRETMDAGRTWHMLSTDYSQSAPVAAQVVFGDGGVGYATSRGSIQRTTDGGVRWSYLKTPGTQ